MERVKGIEPSSEAWEAPALPLSYTRPCALIMSLFRYLRNPLDVTFMESCPMGCSHGGLL